MKIYATRMSVEIKVIRDATVLPHLSDWARKLAPNVVLQPNERDMWELLDEPG